MKIRSNPFLRVAAVAIVFTIASANAGFIQTGAGPWIYTDTNNWASGTIDGLWDSTLTLAEAQTVTFDSDYTLLTPLTFNHAGNFGLTLRSFDGTPRTITLGGNVTVATTGGTSANVTIGNATNILNVNLGGATRTMDVGADRNLTFVNALSNGGLTKTSSGTLTLSGANTYSGTTSLQGGTLVLNGSNSSTGTTTLVTGTLQLGTGTNGGLASGAITLSPATGTGPAPDISNLTGGTVQVSNALIFNGNSNSTTLTVSGNSALTFSGGVTQNNTSGFNALTNNSSATVTFIGSNPFNLTKSTDANDRNFTFRGTGNTVISSVVADPNWNLSNTNYGSLTVNGAGSSLTLSGNNTYHGTTTITAGRINIRHANALGDVLNGTSVASGTALEIQGGITTAAEALSLTGTGISSGGALRNISGNNTYTGAITLTGATRINSDADLLTLDVASGNGITATNQNLTFGGAGNINVADAIATGTGTITKDGNGTLTLSGASTYSGTTTISLGTLKLGAGGGDGTSGVLGTTAAGTSVTSGAVLDINGQSITGEALTLNGTGISSGGALINSSGTAASWSGTLTLGSASSIDTTGNITLSGALAGAYALTKQGAGQLTLSTASTRSTSAGSTTLSNGKLRLTTGSALNTNASAELALNGGTLSLANDSATTFTGTATTVGASSVTVESDVTTLNNAGVTHTLGTLSIGAQHLNITKGSNVGSGTAGVTFGATTLSGNAVFDTAASTNLTLGALADGGTARTITKQGNGSLTLGSAATSLVTGTVVNIQSGTLSLGNNNALGTGGALTITGGSLDVTGARTTTNNNPQNWNGDFTFIGTNTYNTGTGSVTLGGNRIVTVNASTMTVGGIIDDGINTYSLTKAGTGGLTLTGANTYGGDTNINAGTLTIGSTSVATAGSVGNIKFNGTSTLTLAGSAALTLGTISGSEFAGTINDTNTNASAKTLTFANASSFAALTASANALMKLQNGGGTTFFTNFLRSNAAFTTTLDGGTWNVSSMGANSTGAQFGGTLNLINGATLNTASARYSAHGITNIGGTGTGAMNITSSWTAEQASTNPFIYNIQSGGTLSSNTSFLISLASFANQAHALGSARANSININSGGILFMTGGANLTLGGGSGTSSISSGSETNTLNLSGGKLLVSGTLSQPVAIANQTNTFTWSGGQLSAGTITATNMPSSTLANNAGILAPGDVGVAGRTVITGSYTQGESGILSIDLGGATAANAFQNGASGNFDLVTVSGTTNLNGTAVINILPGYRPSGTFDVLTSTGALTASGGNFQTTAQTVSTNEGFSTMTVTTDTTLKKVTLGGYTITNQWAGTASDWSDTAGAASWTSLDPNASTAGALFVNTPGTVNLVNNRTVRNVTFAPASSAFTIAAGGGTLTLDGGSSGPAVLSNASGNNTINAPISVASSGVNAGTASGTTLTLGGALSGSGSFNVYGPGIVALTTDNSSYTGAITVQDGVNATTNPQLLLSHNNALGAASSVTIYGTTSNSSTGSRLMIGNGITVTGKTVTLNPLGQRAALQVATGTTGIWNGDVQVNGSGSPSLWADGTMTVGASSSNVVNSALTLILRGSGTGTLNSTLNLGANGLTKTDAGTWTINNSANYTGITSILGGTLKFATHQNLAGSLSFSSGTGVGTLDLTDANATFGGNLVVQSNTTNANTITIGSGKTLTTNGDVSLGANTNGLVTSLTVNGATGTWNVNRAGGTFQLGMATGTNVGDGASLNLSGLGTFSADLGSAGIFRIGMNGTGSGSVSSTILAATSTITAGTLDVGGLGAGGIHTLKLGSGTQFINANTVYISGRNDGGNNRSSGALSFNTTTGSVTIRDATGSGNANLYMGQNGSTTGSDTSATFDVSGHAVDIKLGDLKMASRNGDSTSVRTQSDTFKFDTGTLTVANQAILAYTTGNTNSANTASMTLGGGAVANGTATFTNGLSLAQNNSTNTSANTAAATLTIQNNTGGYTFNVTSGTIIMGTTTGSANASNAANATLNLLGGTLTMTGNIIAGGTGSGTATRTLNLDGGSLNMQGNSIGSGGGSITSNFQSGTLRNLGELNGGGIFTKTTSGTLTLDGTNTYTGATAVNGGTLVINGDNSGATGAVTVTSASSNATAVRLKGTGTVGGATTFAADPDGASNAAPGDPANNLQVGGIHSPGNSVGRQNFGSTLTYSQGSIFEWELASVDGDTSTGTRGIDFDAVNVGADKLATTGDGAIFRVVLSGSENFSNAFWTHARSWEGIFKTADDGAAVGFASIFSSFQFFNYGGPDGALNDLGDISSIGSFTITGSTLTWTAVPEPTSALAGVLIAAGLLRRRRVA